MLLQSCNISNLPLVNFDLKLFIVLNKDHSELTQVSKFMLMSSTTADVCLTCLADASDPLKMDPASSRTFEDFSERW